MNTTGRIERLYNRLIHSTPAISAERANLYTKGVLSAAAQPVMLQRAYGFSRVLEEMTVIINPDEVIVGNMTEKDRGAIVTPEFGWQWMAKELDFFATRKADALAISETDKASLREVFLEWEGKSVEEVVDQRLGDNMKTAMAAGLTTLGGHATSIGNITPDYAMVLQEGLSGIKARIEQQRRAISWGAIEDGDKAVFYDAALVVLDAAMAFAGRFAALAREMAGKETDNLRKEELLQIATICDRVPCHPAGSFHEALQSLWMTHLMISLESNPHGLLLGRLDRYLWPYYRDDLEAGRITPDQAKMLLSCLWIKVTELIKIRDQFYSEAFSGFPLFQVAMVGGVDESGKDTTNDLSYLTLDVIESVKTTQPSISLRVHEKTPAPLLEKACRVAARAGLGIPAFVNDGVIIPKMILRGAALPEARNYVTNCIEPEIPGMTDSRAHSGYVNFGKCMELALNNGKDPVTGSQVGPTTGDIKNFETFDDVWQAVLKQIKNAIDLIESAYNMCETVHAQQVPEVFLSLFVHDCIQKGKPRQCGGARYNHSTIFGTGVATLVDSLLAIEHLVYHEKQMSLPQLKAFLDDDFAGEERLRQFLLNRCPKYGNDLESADGLASGLIGYFCDEIQKRPSLRNGTYIAEIHSVAMHTIFGKLCGATPNGRKAHQVLSDGISPSQGADHKGPTATIRSVARIDHLKVLNGTLFNQKFNPQCLRSDVDFEKMAALIRSFFAAGGHHIQFNVVDAETLLAAQRQPEAYKSLIVRVAGYSAFFNELTREVQDEIIQRTEQRW